MLTYEVLIGEQFNELPALGRRDPAPEVRSVCWRGKAADEDAARDAAYEAWDRKYGAGQRPAHPYVKVAQLPSQVTP